MLLGSQRRLGGLRGFIRFTVVTSIANLIVGVHGFAVPVLNHDFEVTPVALAQTTSSIPSTGAIRIRKAYRDSGYAYIVTQDFGTLRDTNAAPTRSTLRIFENGRELGAAHSVHADISTRGAGRFSYWGGKDGTAMNLYFSASDNSNPKTNGRMYTYRIDPAPVATTTQSVSTTTSTSSTSISQPVSTTSSQPTSTSSNSSTPTTTPSTPTTSVTSTTTPLTSVSSTGRVFYVSPAGSDSNSGTATSPWRTIKTAALRLAAGDTAILMDGTYEEDQISFANSGTAGQPITIRAQTKWGAILSSKSGCNPGISIDKSYITIEDMRLSISPNNVKCGTYSSANASIRAWNTADPTASNPYSGTQGFVARGLLVDATSASRDTGIKTNQDFSIIENCEVHNEIETVNTNSTVIRNNTVSDGGPYGTYILGKGGTRNLQIYNNVVNITQPGTGILLGGATGIQWAFDPSTGIEVYNSVAYNNVVVNKTGDPSVGLFGIRGAQDSAFVNNVGIGGGQMYLGLGGASNGSINPVFKNNILVGTGGSATGSWDGYWTGTLTVDHNNFYNYGSTPSQPHPISGNPLLTSDWHLQSGSPARGAGVVVTVPGFNSQDISVSLNKDGVPRSTPWNLGID